MPSDSSLELPPLLVVCLCAQWCGTCRDYQPLFTQLQAEFPRAQFSWVDIEDESELVDPVEIENFPTLLIARNGKPLFFGTAMPHLETLRRLVQNHHTTVEPSARQSDEVMQLTGRLTARPHHRDPNA